MSEIEQDSPNWISPQRQALAERGGARINNPRMCNNVLHIYDCEYYCELPPDHTGSHAYKGLARDGVVFTVAWGDAIVSIPTMQQDVPRMEGVTTTNNAPYEGYTPVPPWGMAEDIK